MKNNITLIKYDRLVFYFRIILFVIRSMIIFHSKYINNDDDDNNYRTRDNIIFNLTIILTIDAILPVKFKNSYDMC